MLRQKVAITSDRPQTTRNAIRGVLTTPRAQLVFVDTPGLHKPQSALGKRLNQVVRNALSEVDVIAFMVDPSDGVGGGDAYIAKELLDVRTPIVVALNKLDRTPIHKMGAATKQLATLGDWDAYAISARTGEGVPAFVNALIERLPEGPVLYPPDAVTDQPERQVISELIREKVLQRTREEVPHSVAVAVDEIQEDNGFRIYATIYVERDPQKGIVIGKGGGLLKEIGTTARRDIESLLGCSIHLDLRVKVAKDWQQKDSSVARFGYGE
jgi:GTP-binding protein Era